MAPLINIVLPHGVSAPEPREDFSEDDISGIEDGRLVWTIPTGLYLCRCGHRVRFDTDVRDDAINLSHGRTLRELGKIRPSFIVSCDADWAPVGFAALRIVQNKACAGGRAFFIPHWPQPGLVPREESEFRHRIGYVGRVDDPEKFRHFTQMARERGFDFNISPPGAWHDYSQYDFVANLRFLSPERIARKPATKLINAWRAHVPFVSMREPAIAELGSHGVDCLLADDPESVLEGIVHLRDNPGLYRSIVHNGIKKATEFEFEATAQRWSDFVSAIAAPEFERWQRQTWHKARFRWRYLQYSGGAHVVSRTRRLLKKVKGRNSIL